MNKRFLGYFLVPALVFAFLPGMLYADDSRSEELYQQARAYYLGTQVIMDKQKALALFTRAAQSGHARAQNSLGTMYEFGEGTEASDEAAVQWYGKSAESGYWGGRLNLARKKLLGQGIRRNITAAMQDIYFLAEQGNPNAQVLLTTIYSSILPDYGIEKNDEEAVKWCRMAAEQGFDKAEGLLGHFYHRGIGVARDEKLALFWLEAASTGDAEAQYEIASLLAEGAAPESEQASEAVIWLEKAARQGHAAAQYALGRSYMKGIGVKRDYHHGLKWLMLSARQDNPYAANYLGLAFRKGLGVVQDPGQAVHWYTRAAKEGNLRAAQFNLGRMYETGFGVPKDEETALRWYSKAAEQGHRESAAILAERGFIINRNTSFYEASLAS